MIITVCLNPALDKTLTVERVNVGGVNRVVSSRLDAGGKAINVSKMVKNLGGETLALGIVGGETGAYLQAQLDSMGIAHDFVMTHTPTRTNYKIDNRTLRKTTDFNEPGEPVSEEVLEQVWQKIASAAKPGDMVAFSGTNPPGTRDDLLAGWVRKLLDSGIRVSLDTVGESMRLGIAEHPTIIKPNQAELSDLFGRDLHYTRDIIAVARQVAQQGVEYVVVTLGASGAIFVTKSEVLYGHGLEVPVGSTVGAGDATLGSILYDMQRGLPWEETARRSIAAGAAKVMCEGSQTPLCTQMEELIDKVMIEKL
ncbi:MAG: 1-phosphofructokinase [Oscillospiraceae bacterium]|nr:1-phosphofructokinase [Oscillospiraceae bacterium]